VIELLPSKCEALSSNPSTAKIMKIIIIISSQFVNYTANLLSGKIFKSE
jgi:hypothetical protein